MEELIDVLDEKQQLIGHTTRQQAHKSGVWHRAVHGYLINSKGEIVMQRRSADKDLYPGYWDGSFAGHVDAGESTLKAAVRECEEELGIKVNADELEYVFTTPESMVWGDLCNNEFVDAFICRKDFGKFSKQDSEVSEIKVVPIEEFIKMIESRDKNLFPHYPEFDNLIPVLRKLK